MSGIRPSGECNKMKLMPFRYWQRRLIRFLVLLSFQALPLVGSPNLVSPGSRNWYLHSAVCAPSLFAHRPTVILPLLYENLHPCSVWTGSLHETVRSAGFPCMNSNTVHFLHLEPSMIALSLGSDVISSIKIVSSAGFVSVGRRRLLLGHLASACCRVQGGRIIA